MARVTTIRVGAMTILILVAALISLLFVFVIGGEDGGKKLGSLPLPGISLGLTAEARASLQAIDAFPGPDPAGFAAIWSGDAALMDITAAREAILQTSGASGRRSGVGSIVEVGNNFFISDVPIRNITGINTVRLFVSQPASGDTGDTRAWVVAFYLHTGGARNPTVHSAALAWNAVALGPDLDNPLVAIDRLTNVDAIHEVTDVLGLDPVDVFSSITWFHFGFPQATNFAMMAKARGTVGTSVVSFALPAGTVLHEVSAMKYVMRHPCCNTLTSSSLFVDGATIFDNTLADRKEYTFLTGSFDSSFNPHTMSVTHQSVSDLGSTGAGLAFLYHVP